jgi:hypothetical protein
MKYINLKQHDSTPITYNDKIVSNLIINKTCKLTSKFKEFMISDYVEEFLKRFYTIDEALERLPRIANYYRNYSKFFCRPRFGDLAINILLESNGDFKAELYYKQNYVKKTDGSLYNIETLLTTTVKQDIDENILTVRNKPTESLLGTSVSFLNDGQAIFDSSGLLTAKQSKNTSLIGLIFNLNEKNEKNEKNRIKFNKYNVSTIDKTKLEGCHTSKNSENKDFRELKEKTDNIEKIEKLSKNVEKIVIANKSASNIKLGFPEKSRNQRKSLDRTNSMVRSNVSNHNNTNAKKTTININSTNIKLNIKATMPKYSFQTMNLEKPPSKQQQYRSIDKKTKLSSVLIKPNIDKLTKQISKMGKEQITKLIRKETPKIQFASIDNKAKVKPTTKSKDHNEFMTMNLTPNQSKDAKIVTYYKNVYSSRSIQSNNGDNNNPNPPKTITKKPPQKTLNKPSLEYKIIEVNNPNSRNGNNNGLLNSHKKSIVQSQSRNEHSSLESRIFKTCNYINSLGIKILNF